VLLYMKSDQILLEWIRGSEEVGQYSIAVRCSECLFFLPIILSQTYLPKIGVDDLNANSNKIFLRGFYKASWILGAFMMFLNFILFPKFVPIVFGNEYITASSALRLLAPAAFAVSCGCASNVWLNRKGFVNLISKRTLVGAILNIFLDLVLIPKYGFNGAAVATSISYLVSVFHIGFYDILLYEHISEVANPFSKKI